MRSANGFRGNIEVPGITLMSACTYQIACVNAKRNLDHCFETTESNVKGERQEMFVNRLWASGWRRNVRQEILCPNCVRVRQGEEVIAIYKPKKGKK